MDIRQTKFEKEALDNGIIFNKVKPNNKRKRNEKKDEQNGYDMRQWYLKYFLHCANTNSHGLSSGEYTGKNHNVIPATRINMNKG